MNARSCKHLKSLLGEKYEEARVKLKNPDGPLPSKGKASASRNKPTSKAKAAAGKKRKKLDEDAGGEDDEEGQEENKEPIKKKTRKAPTSRGKGKVIVKDEDEDAGDKEVELKVDEVEADGEAMSSDELAEINGIKPKVYLKDGAEREVSSMSSVRTYILAGTRLLNAFILVD